MTRRDLRVLAGTGIALVLSLAAIGALPAPHLRVPVFLALYALAFAAYAVAGHTVLRRKTCGRPAAALILGVAVLGHAAVLPARPDLSTDIYRYLWEGRVVLDGANPFAVAPVDSSLAHLRDAGYENVSHKHLSTIYPPLAQALFALAAKIRPGVFTLKVIFSLFDIATVLVLFRLLRRLGRSEAHALVYAWSPLVIVETGHSGHVDAAGVFLLVLGLHLYLGGRPLWAGAVLGLSFLAKYLAVVTAPFLARRRAAALGALAAVAALGYAPFLDAGPRLIGSLREYGASWSFNGPPYLALSGLLGDPAVARRLLAAFGVAFALAAAFRERDALRYAFLVIGCALVVSPTVYPWYVTWLVPLLCVFPGRGWIAFTGLVPLSYVVWGVYGRTGAWVLPTWVLAAEYLPFYGLLLLDFSRPLRGRGARA